MAETADLHLHSTYSDGTLTLTEVLRWIGERHVKVFSVTDHDTTEGLKEAESWANQHQVNFIPGLELSAICQDQEVHLLSYFSDWQNESFQEFLLQIRNRRLERTGEIIEKLRGKNINISLDALIRFSATTNLTRAHIARFLEHLGYVQNIKEAFKRLIGHDGPCFVPVSGVSSKEGIDRVHAIGGLVFVAHPALTTNDSILNQLAEEGLDGVEAYHSSHNKSQIDQYSAWANEKSLMISGGSDCHGTSDRGIQIGKCSFPVNDALKIYSALGVRSQCN
jgi:predicted metal-dependent phosphoesterase TrpH